MLLLLLKMTIILMLALIGFVPNAESEQSTYPDEIPIGALIDDNYRGEETLTAFSYAISSQNEKHPNFRLNNEDPSVLSMTDNFAVTQRICQLMANGTFALFTSHTMDTTDTIKSYSSTFQMPFITAEIAMNTSGQDFGYELYMRPYYVKAIRDIVKYKKGKDIWYLYDSDEGLERLMQLMDGFAQNAYYVKTRIYRVQNVTDAYVTLQRLMSHQDDGMTILLDFPTKDCEELLQRLNIERRAIYHHFIVVGLGIGEMNLEALQLTIVGLRLVDRRSSTVRSFLSKWSLLDPKAYKGAARNQISYEAALAVDAVGVISRALQRMISEKPTVFKQMLPDGKISNNGSEGINCDAEPVQIWQHGYDIMKAMREIEFGGLTGDIRFDKFGLRRDYKLDLIEFKQSRGLIKVGQWHSETGLDVQIPAEEGQPKEKISIANRTFIITSIVTEPYLTLNDLPFKGNDMFKGYCADLARKIADRVGFNYKIAPVKDGKYGSKGDNLAWNGMVGELIRHEADIAIAPLTITSERERVIDFSVPFMSTGITIMMKKPTKDLGGAFAFLNPLSHEIWICIVSGYFGVQILLFLFNRLTQCGSFVENKAGTKKFNILSCLCTSQRPVRSVYGRVLNNVWSLATIFLISIYTAKLYSSLRAERMKSTIESADDLASQTEVKYGIIQSGSTAEFFRQSTNPVYEQMWAFMKTRYPSVFVMSTDEGVDRVRNSKYAFIAESITVDYINVRAPCDTMKVGRNLNMKGYGIATPLGSDLRDLINIAVLELTESGELHILQKKWWHDGGECPYEHPSTRRGLNVGGPLKLSKVAGLFYMLIGCLILGLIILIFERLCKSPIEARIRKKENPPHEENIEVMERL